MAIEITVPRLGWSAEEATFACWLKKDGEKVTAGEGLLELEGDKSLAEIESMDSGILRLLPNSPQKGEVVKVGQLIGYLLADGEQIPLPAISAGPVEPRKPASVEPAPVPTVPAISPPAPSTTPSTPRARRASTNLGVDLAKVEGSGKGGRIRERDVLAAIKQPSNALAPEAPQTGTDMVVSTMRRTIADRMMQSLANTAPVTLTSKVDATNLVVLRNEFKAAKGNTIVPAYTDIIAKLAATALARFPAISGQWKGDRISIPANISIGIAVDTEYGLIVPVIRDVPRLTLTEVAQTSRDLIEAAYARKLKSEDLSGGVFTITNLGAFGIDAFTPIINYPETAILGLGAIRREPAVVDGKNITIREQITLSLTFDHRVLDGAPAARFLQALAQGIENPILWLLGAPVTGTKTSTTVDR